MDPLTVVGTGLAVLGSKDILNKLLGPTADYVGGEVKGLVEKCNINLDNVFAKAVHKLGPKVDEPGSVNPRVLKHVFDEGRFCEDEVTAEYYGGILASARSENGRDDRAVTYLSLIKDLSTYQVRMHYLIYTLVRRLYSSTTLEIGRAEIAQKMAVYIPASVYVAAMDFSPKENAGAILTHCIVGLVRLNLIREDWTAGSVEFLKTVHQSAKESGAIVRPTLLGASLFLWASGIHGATGHELLTASGTDDLAEVKIVEGAQKVVAG
jgi:hypothetical protein